MVFVIKFMVVHAFLAPIFSLGTFTKSHCKPLIVGVCNGSLLAAF